MSHIAENIIKDTIHLLRDLQIYMDSRADVLDPADYDGRQVPNQEMFFVVEIENRINILKELIK